MQKERVTGLEPVHPAWKAGALPTELYPQFDEKKAINKNLGKLFAYGFLCLVNYKNACRGGGTRTHGLTLPKRALYQAELRPVKRRKVYKRVVDVSTAKQLFR